MEERKLLKNEELDQVTGGGEYDCHTNPVITTCICGGEITLECDIRRNSGGITELKCPNCDRWYKLV